MDTSFRLRIPGLLWEKYFISDSHNYITSSFAIEKNVDAWCNTTHSTWILGYSEFSVSCSWKTLLEHSPETANKTIRLLCDSNRTRTHNHIVCKRTPNHSAKLAKCLSCVVSTYLYGVFDCVLLSCHVRISEGIYTL